MLNTAKSIRLLTVILVIAWFFLVITRIAGPSDIYDKEQPRTIAYTADMLTNGHWLLPYDTFGIPATKPPLYNWISVPFVAAFGYAEWALKMPSILASLGILVCIVLAGRRLTIPEHPDNANPLSFGLLAALLYLATPMTAKLLYVARPDMLLTAFLAGAWLAATIIVQSPKPHRAAQLAFWLCTTAAAFTKGPSALLAIVYLLLAAKLIGGKWSTLARTGWWWGLPFLLLTVGIANYFSYQQEPEFFREVLLGREVAGRVTKPGQIFATLLNGPAYMITRFLPWSLFAIAAFFFVRPRQWFRHPLGPAILWLLIILITFSFMTTKRPDRYAPVFPPMAIMAAYAMLHLSRRTRLRALHFAPLAVVVIIALAVYNQFWSEGAKTRFGDNAIAFARQVRATTGTDPILFTDGELTPVQTLVGQNHPPTLPPEKLAAITWVISFHEPNSNPVLVSEPIDQVDGPNPGRLALYRVTPTEAAARYQQSLAAWKIYSDNDTTNSKKTPNDNRWRQFTRPHTITIQK
jgi:4-amino-4-deoxy-L-arabinose transferase-like glycosyltransferase